MKVHLGVGSGGNLTSCKFPQGQGFGVCADQRVANWPLIADWRQPASIGLACETILAQTAMIGIAAVRLITARRGVTL